MVRPLKFYLTLTILLVGSIIHKSLAQTLSQEYQAEIDMALLEAVFEEEFELVVELLDFGANVNARDYSGISALMYALMGEDEDIIFYLLHKGAEINANDNAGMSVLMHAILAGKDKYANLFIPYITSINQQNIDGYTALTFAVQADKLNLVQSLIVAGADITLKTEKGTTPLMHAAAFGSFFSLDYLAYLEADINQQANDGSGAMHLAAFYGHNEIIGLLLDWGGDIELPDGKGNTPLMVAVMAQQAETVWYLIESGASPVAVNIHGFTPLSLSSGGADEQITELLLYYDFVEPVTQNKNQSALAYTFFKRHRKQERLLRNLAGAKPQGLYFSEFWLKQGADFNRNDFMYHAGMGFFESRFRIVIMANALMRLGHKSLMVPQTDNLTYQFRERRQIWSLGIMRELVLLHSPLWGSAGLLPGVEIGYSTANYRGTGFDPPGGFGVVPVVSLFWHRNKFSFFATYNFYNTRQSDIPVHRFRGGIAYRFPFYKFKQLKYQPILN